MTCSHVFMFGLLVMINANSVFGVGYYLSWLIYNERLGNILKALLWLGWFVSSNGEKVCIMCWYFGWSFIVHGMKYVLDLSLCASGCSFNTLGTSPGFDSISPHVCRITCIIYYNFFYLDVFVYMCILFLVLWVMMALVSSIWYLWLVLVYDRVICFMGILGWCLIFGLFFFNLGVK